MKAIVKYGLLGLAAITISQQLTAQLLHTENGWSHYASQMELNSGMHTSVYPVYRCDLNTNDTCAPKELLNYTLTNLDENSKYYHPKKLIFSARPLLHSEVLMNSNSRSFSGGYGAGVQLEADYNNKIATHFDLSYVNFALTDHLNEFSVSNGVLPGTGKVLNQQFPHNIYSNFHLAYRPFREITIEAGFGKHFLGDGYRSLLLSYNAYNYPYMQVELNVWHIQYRLILAQLKDINIPEAVSWGDFKTKYTYFHYFDWKVCKWLNIGAFEGIVSGVNHHFDPSYLNPVIFYRPVEFSLGSVDNALLGLNIKFSLSQKTYIYGQFLLDDFNVEEFKNDIRHLKNPEDASIKYGFFGNKYAAQLGIKSFNIFTIPYLNAFSELNFSRPYTYSHVVSQQNYGHFNQSLAHPLGANFIESVSGISYLHKRFLFEGKFMFAFTGLDTTGTHFGQNIYQPTMDAIQNGNIPVSTWYNKIGQGVATNIIYAELSASYFINPKQNLAGNITLGLRRQSNEIAVQQNIFFKIGISGMLFRRYTDF